MTFSLKKIVKLCLLIVFVSTSMTNLAAFAEVTAYVNQQSVYQGDILTLRIETDNQRDAPDISGLEENFVIKGRTSNSRINIINGRRSFKKVWIIELQANSVGEFTIPEIILDNDKTQPITISVKELPPEISAENSKHVFIESSIDIQNDETYVQQQIPYTIKLYYDASMSSGEIILPIIENANIRILGQEKRYKAVRKTNEFIVVERRYVISPEKSGELVIPPTKVEGRLQITGSVAPSKRRNDFDSFNDFFSSGSMFSNRFDPFSAQQQSSPTRPFTISSEPFKVNVLGIPDSFTGSSWLPAEEIKMQDSWTSNPPILKVGEPVTRSVIMQVKGLASSQIPDIPIPKSANMKVYPEKAESETPNDGNTVYGVQRVNITYIPEKQGEITIPQIDIDWWDVNNKKQQTYTLPEWRLSVAAGELSEDINESISEPEPTIPAETIKKEEIQVEDSVTKYWVLKTILGALVLFLCFFLLLIFRKRYLHSFRYINKTNQRKLRLETERLRSALLVACTKNDKEAAAELLISYVTLLVNNPKIQSLGAVASTLDLGSGIVKELELSLYANTKQDWIGADLYKLVSDGLEVNITETEMKEGLAPLYPY